jgi:hypothetical protein
MRRIRNALERPVDSVSVKVGGWFEACATGWGILAAPIIVAAVAILVGLKALF